MADLQVEVFRDDVDQLTARLMNVLREHVVAMPYIDRSIIVAAALGNVACIVDVVETPYTAKCTTRLKRIAESWKIEGGL